ncbi:lysylphosphatidylglycerol synthase transmembrane domain-containing protein [Haladaptatus sp. DYF46]|uniref:lysylphosphatidylglycerol synthase transmembrane domain-containing protein n=1 Tax=Haladaptatus sp. DYF46 TaxID=2886041 RepID=UPI001E35F71C|nr:lysylphosphatidylglycerol synthase transmembrane domain-containing protein [Haladaptatus sp. DYF46]
MVDGAAIARRVGTPENALSFLFAGGVVALTAWSMAGVDWSAVLGYLVEMNPVSFLFALVTFHGLSLVRSLRWRTLLRNVGYELTATGPFGVIVELTRIVYLGWFANCITVARLGDVYRCSLLQRSADVDFSVAVGTVLTERIVDLSILLLVLGVATLVAFRGGLPSLVTTAMLAGTALSVFGIAGVLVLQHSGKRIERLVPSRVRRYFAQLRHGTLNSFDRLPALVGYTAIGWIIEGVTMYAVAMAIGVSLSLASAFVAALVAVLLSTIPVTPGGLGVTEAGIAFVLGWVGLDATAVAAVTVLNRLISYWSVVGIGLLVYGIGLRFPISLSATTARDGSVVGVEVGP